jgi:hypothetical protein
MLKPTPVRVIYLIVGLALGAAIFFGVANVLGLFGPRQVVAPAVVTAPHFTGQALQRVLPVNATAERDGVSVRLNALELYSDGVGFTYSIVSPRIGARARVLDIERFVVTDNRGTTYALAPFVGSSVPTAGYTTGYVIFSPAVPEDVNTLRVGVPNLLVLGTRVEGEPRVIDGPWEFQIPVR